MAHANSGSVTVVHQNFGSDQKCICTHGQQILALFQGLLHLTELELQHAVGVLLTLKLLCGGDGRK